MRNCIPTSAAPGGRKCGSCAPLAFVSGKSPADVLRNHGLCGLDRLPLNPSSHPVGLCLVSRAGAGDKLDAIRLSLNAWLSESPRDACATRENAGTPWGTNRNRMIENTQKNNGLEG